MKRITAEIRETGENEILEIFSIPYLAVKMFMALMSYLQQNLTFRENSFLSGERSSPSFSLFPK